VVAIFHRLLGRFCSQHPPTDRPWGTYQVILDQPHTKVKKIVVQPGKRLSYQFHHRRRETWVVTKGVGRITLGNGGTVIGSKGTVRRGGTEWIVTPGDTVMVPVGCPHRIGCPDNSDHPLELMEVQTGGYFGEDDIVRLEDDWGRA